MTISVPQPESKSLWPWIIGLLLVGVVGSFLYVGSLNSAVSTTTTTTATGSCPGVNLQQQAFLLAQQAELTRKTSSYAGNYANAWFQVCFTNGKSLSDTVRPIRGFYDEEHPADSFKTHSEQGVYIFLQPKLAALKLDANQVIAIDVVIFSQVRVCDPCQQSMVSWQSGLRQVAGIPNLFLSIWDLGFKGFSPKRFPAGTGTPVTIDALHMVDIPFT
jgi:hypothetical protein